MTSIDRFVIRAVIAVAVSAALGACGDDGSGGGGGGPGDPPSAAEVTASCQMFEAHATACGWGGNVNGYDWNCPEAGLVWRAAAFRAFASCAETLACDGIGQTCYLAAMDAVEPIAVHQAYATRCTQRMTECGGSTLICDASRFEVFVDDSVNRIIACFDSACPDILTCFERG